MNNFKLESQSLTYFFQSWYLHATSGFFFNIFAKTQLRQNSQSFKIQDFFAKLKIFLQNSFLTNTWYTVFHTAQVFSHIIGKIKPNLHFESTNRAQNVKILGQNFKTQVQNCKTQVQNFKTQIHKLKTQFSGNSCCLPLTHNRWKKSLK